MQRRSDVSLELLELLEAVGEARATVKVHHDTPGVPTHRRPRRAES